MGQANKRRRASTSTFWTSKTREQSKLRCTYTASSCSPECTDRRKLRTLRVSVGTKCSSIDVSLKTSPVYVHQTSALRCAAVYVHPTSEHKWFCAQLPLNSGRVNFSDFACTDAPTLRRAVYVHLKRVEFQRRYCNSSTVSHLCVSTLSFREAFKF